MLFFNLDMKLFYHLKILGGIVILYISHGGDIIIRGKIVVFKMIPHTYIENLQVLFLP